MHANRFVIVVSLLSLAGCGATQAQRRTNGSLAIAAGASLFVVGMLMADTEDDDDCDDDGTSQSLCLDLFNENAIGGGLLMITGTGFALGGLIGVTSGREPEGAETPSPPPAPATGDPAACIEWQRELDAETDPARRGALHAIRPAHCPRPGAPPPDEDRSAASPGG